MLDELKNIFKDKNVECYYLYNEETVSEFTHRIEDYKNDQNNEFI